MHSSFCKLEDLPSTANQIKTDLVLFKRTYEEHVLPAKCSLTFYFKKCTWNVTVLAVNGGTKYRLN